MDEAKRIELVKLGFLCEAAAKSADVATLAGRDKFHARAAAFHQRSAEMYSAMAFRVAQS